MQTALSAGQMKAAAPLLDEVKQVGAVLRKLVSDYGELPQKFREEASTALDDVERRLNRRDLYVAVVGEMKAGKSTFLNAILGQALLGSAKREFTGTVTYLHHGSAPDYWYTLRTGGRRTFAEEIPDRSNEIRRHIRECQAAEAPWRQALDQAEKAYALAGGQVEQVQRHLQLLEQRVAATRQFFLARQGEQQNAAIVVHQITAERDEAAHLLPAFLRDPPAWWALWVWLLRWMLGWFWRAPYAAWREADARAAEASTRAQQAAQAQEAAQGSLNSVDESVATAQGQLAHARYEHERCARERQSAAQGLDDAWRRRSVAEASLAAHHQDRTRRFAEQIRRLGDTSDLGSHVAELHLLFPSAHLARGLVLMDTPGVNTTTAANSERAWAAIAHDADACILLSHVGQGMSKTTRDFLGKIVGVVPHVSLVATKVDKALEDADDSDESPREQVEHTLKQMKQTFAGAIGKSPSAVNCISVSAAKVLPETSAYSPDEALNFTRSIDQLLQIVYAEKSIALGARLYRTIEGTLKAINDAVSTAEIAFQKRISELEASRLPHPKEEVERLTAHFLPALQQDIEEATARSREATKAAIKGAKRDLEAAVQACSSSEQMDALAKNNLGTYFEAARTAASQVAKDSSREMQHAAGLHMTAAANALLERYRIVERLTSARPVTKQRQATLGASISTIDISKGAVDVMGNLDTEAIVAGGAGVGLGAAIGTVILPGLGTAIGAGVGALVGWLFAPSLEDRKKKVLAELEPHWNKLRSAGLEAIETSKTEQLCAAQTELRRKLEVEIARFNDYVGQLLAAERQAIEGERKKLSTLKTFQQELKVRQERLVKLFHDAERSSAGLARNQDEPENS